VIAPRSQPPAAATATSAPEAATATPAPSVGQPLTLSSANPLRKQTLLGIAPVLPTAAAAAEPTSVPSIATPAAVLATDAPTSSDVAPAPTPTLETKPRRAPAPAALSISHDDLPELKPRRPRWVAPLGVAALLALGVVGLRQLDRAPTEPPIAAVKTVPAKPAAAAHASPKSDDGDDDDDDPNTGTEPPLDPTPSEPDPLKARADAAKTAPPSPASAAAPTPDAVASATAPAGDTVRINVDSDPPGARLFWKGKEVGTTPFVLELKTGEKHAYELGLTGYTTRKVVIDGSKTDISIGLKPDPGTFIGASSRK
jgi:hypothetical protein